MDGVSQPWHDGCDVLLQIQSISEAEHSRIGHLKDILPHHLYEGMSQKSVLGILHLPVNYLPKIPVIVRFIGHIVVTSFRAVDFFSISMSSMSSAIISIMSSISISSMSSSLSFICVRCRCHLLFSLFSNSFCFSFCLFPVPSYRVICLYLLLSLCNFSFSLSHCLSLSLSLSFPISLYILSLSLGPAQERRHGRDSGRQCPRPVLCAGAGGWPHLHAGCRWRSPHGPAQERRHGLACGGNRDGQCAMPALVVGFTYMQVAVGSPTRSRS